MYAYYELRKVPAADDNSTYTDEDLVLLRTDDVQQFWHLVSINHCGSNWSFKTMKNLYSTEQPMVNKLQFQN